MKSLTKNYSINATAEEVWDALTNPDRIDAWSNTIDNQISENALDEFSIFENLIWGKNLEVEPQRYLKQEWYYQGWEEPSFVVFELIPQGNATALSVTQTDIPDNQKTDELAHFWDADYIGPLIQFVEPNN